MGIFSRVRDIISSNINAMLDRAEDPEKLVKLMIQEMEDTLVELKASCAGVIAAKKRAERAQGEALGRSRSWAGKAELAVEKGREDLAREALTEKRRYGRQSETMEEEVSRADTLIDRYREEMVLIEDKLATAREKQRMLIQRHVHAQKKKRAEEDIRKFDTSDVFVRFEQFENRIERMEAEADLVNYGRKPAVEDEFDRLAVDDEIERELKAIKERATKRETDPSRPMTRPAPAAAEE